jgi:16S rRNA processing protein RimM
VLVAASGVVSREQAEALRGLELYVPRARLPQPDEDEFYHEDLIGLDAVDRAGVPCGRIVAVLNHGAGDVLELSGEGGRSLMLPFTREAVPEIDLAQRRVVVDPPAERLWPGEPA